MVRIAVLSDIHANGIALDAVLADLPAQAVDQVLCLGDAIQGGPQPAAVSQRLRELNWPMVMGNADAFLLNADEPDPEPTSDERQRILHDVRAWHLTQLSQADLDFIRTFQPTVELPLGGGRVLLGCHGSPTSFNDVLLPWTPQEDFDRLCGAYRQRIMGGGHTHVQYMRRVADFFFFNPGSVGLTHGLQESEDQLRLEPWAAYAILTVDEGKIALEFRQIPFDVTALIEVYRASGRPHSAYLIRQYGGAV